MSFQQGLSGLNATSNMLGVIGNNIANAGTYGAKASRAEFADAYSTATGGSSNTAIGAGVSLSAVTQQFTSGSITATDRPMDLAIDGDGFFQIQSGNTTEYSRDGEFQLDKDGNIVNSRGAKLLGYAATTDGIIFPSTLQTLKLPSNGVSPQQTTKISFQANLDSRASVTKPASGPVFDFNDPATSNFATSLVAYDTKGQPMAATLYFQKTAEDTWDVYGTANGRLLNDTNGDGTGDPLPIVSALTFSTDGSKVLSPAGPVQFNIPAVPLQGGVSTVPIGPVSLDLTKATQVGSDFAVSSSNQDGYSAGQIVSVNVGSDGLVNANYSNGQIRTTGRVVLARFRDPQGLQPVGNNAWRSGLASGDPILGDPSSGNFGALKAGALEESNVDVTKELVDMITTQRAYQANAQTIKTEDQVVQTLLNLR